MAMCRIAAALVPVVLLSACAAQRTSDGCFDRWENAKTNCLTPSQTVTGTQTECEQACLSSSSQCAIADYTVAKRLCEMYASNALPPPPPVLNGGGRKRRKRGTVLANRGGRHALVQHPPPSGRGQVLLINRQPPHMRPLLLPVQVPVAVPAPRYVSTDGCGGGPTVRRCGGVIHMRPSGACSAGGGGTTTGTTAGTVTTRPPVTQPLPQEAQCASGQVPRYVLYESTEVTGPGEETTFTTRSLNECLQACTENSLADGSQAPCRGIVFTGGQCTLTMDAPPPNGQGELGDNLPTDYYEKTCVDDAEYTRCPGPLLVDPDNLLVGHAETVATAATLDECMGKCMDAVSEFGFTCLSGMMFYDSDELNCVLNSVTRDADLSLYTESPDEKIDYFETRCRRQLQQSSNSAVLSSGRRALSRGATVAKGAQRSRRQGKSTGGLLPTGAHWGTWTMCSADMGIRYRFRSCPPMPAPSKCKRDWQRCRVAGAKVAPGGGGGGARRKSSQCTPTTQCCAVVRPNGTRDCSRGKRISLHAGLTVRDCVPDDC